jgi:hypothetical protein
MKVEVNFNMYNPVTCEKIHIISSFVKGDQMCEIEAFDSSGKDIWSTLSRFEKDFILEITQNELLVEIDCLEHHGQFN